MKPRTPANALYLGTAPETLAAKLGDLLAQQLRQGDPFRPARIVVPNRYLGKWLRLWLARRFGVAFNLHFDYLETTLWDLLCSLDSRTHETPPELLSDEQYQLLTLSILLEEKDPELASLQKYLEKAGGESLSRLSCRRAWGLAHRLAGLVRDYEYHRQQTLILPWLDGEYAFAERDPFLQELEAGQRCLFRHVVREGDGRRALLNAAAGKNCKTLPQYAGEVRDLAMHNALPRESVYLFGVTQASALHVDLLHWLGGFFDLRVFHLNPLVSRLQGRKLGDFKKVVENFRVGAAENIGAGSLGHEDDALLHLWAQAGAESLGLMTHLIQSRPAFAVENLDPSTQAPGRSPEGSPPTVLQSLQNLILAQPSPTALPQDDSLLIVACPSPQREVETVHNAILRDLQRDPQLLQTDIAILVTDMAAYRPVIQSVFGREPRHLRFNLADFSAARLSTFGQALVDMLDLAQESCTRSAVLNVIMNPCFLARLGVGPDQAGVWLHWADTLGVFQGWDEADRRQRGQGTSALHGWKLALQRLRLGRFMAAPPDVLDRPAPRFGQVVPHADLHSQDRDKLDAFCRAVEGLLPTLLEWRSLTLPGQVWAERLAKLVHLFLDVPEERPEEAPVRDQLLESLEDLRLWDHLANPVQPLPLALVREFVQARLEAIPGSAGDYLTGGITISAMQPMRPVPFPIVYVLGMNEKVFPGGNFLSTIDLRGHQRQLGDIHPAEHQRFLFLEALLAARRKICFTYTCRDLQKDQELLAASPLHQLQRYLNARVLKETFVVVQVPLAGQDPAYCLEAAQPFARDILVQYNEADKFLALEEARQQGTKLPAKLGLAVDHWLQQNQDAEAAPTVVPSTAVPGSPGANKVQAVMTSDLKNFLENPLVAGFKKRLRLQDDDEVELQDDEPFVASDQVRKKFLNQLLNHLVVQAGTVGLESALAQWPDWFDRLYDDGQLRSMLPAEGFDLVDRPALRAELENRLAAEGGLVDFLRQRAGQEFCGPLLIGESFTPLGARWRRPALELPGPDGAAIRLSGWAPLVWRGGGSLDFLVWGGNKSRKEIEGKLWYFHLEPALLYLMLLAHPQSGGKKPLQFKLHVAIATEIVTLEGDGDLKAAAAQDYLMQVTRDFLARESFDHLPLDVINRESELRAAYLQPDMADAPVQGEAYQGLLEETIMDKEEGYKKDAPSTGVNLRDLAEMVNWQVPPDALDKVRRRLQVLAQVLGLTAD